ncbi:MAG: SRPBCC domain-containing protein [Fimbriimonadaceae bacterium]|nr:MAG: SRPBCC domain-containing protein [Fimbriimonadaceae bacterium]
MQDSIVREIILPADPLTVWEKSFGSLDALTTWFLPTIEGSFEVGSILTFDCGEQVAQAQILEIDAPHKLVWRGHTGGAFRLSDFPESEMTTDTFTLETHPEGTKVTVVESGFSNIPEPRYSDAFKGNEEGWDIVLPKMASTYQS